jgi:hypothetical protein
MEQYLRKLSLKAQLIFIPLLIGTAFCAFAEEGSEEFVIESSKTLSFKAFNKSLSVAVEKGESWSHDPIRVALAFIDSAGARLVTIWRKDGRGEMPNSTTVTIVEDGYLDDLIRGTWTQFKMTRGDDNTWRIEKIQRAYRCWRGENQNCYSAKRCP